MDRLSDNWRDRDGAASYDYWCALRRLRREAEEGRAIAALAERLAAIAARVAAMRDNPIPEGGTLTASGGVGRGAMSVTRASSLRADGAGHTYPLMAPAAALSPEAP